jgi:hypothetical protein
VGAHIQVPPLRKAASYSFIIQVAAVEEQFPVGPAKGDAAAQFPQVFPTRMIRSQRQIVFEFGSCSFLFTRYSGDRGSSGAEPAITSAMPTSQEYCYAVLLTLLIKAKNCTD